MDKIKRNERLGAMTKILTDTPNRIHTLGEFCELFGAAKSTISEDIDLVSASFERFDLGRIETVAGAAGGARFPARRGQAACWQRWRKGFLSLDACCPAVFCIPRM